MAAILKGIKFYGCMLATTRGIQSSYLRRDNNGPLFRQHAARMPDFSRCLAIQSAQPQVRNARMAEVSETVSSSSTPTSNVQSLDRALYRIDQDIRRVGRVTRKDVEEVFCDVKEIGGATSTQVLMMIRCCGNLVPDEPPPVRTQLVQEIWGSLEGMGVPLDVSHYNALLRVYIENEHKFSPLEFLSYMEQKGVEPNRVTYQRLITRFCQDGDIDGASKILEFMKQKELPINENVFNALIMGHARANDLESARGILSVMKQAQVEPSADTYTALLKAYAERREIETMKEIFNEVQQKEVEMPDRDYMEVIACLAEAGYEGEFIDEICAKFRKVSGFNQEVMNVCMRLINGGHEDVAKKLLYLMERPVGEDGTPLQMGGFFIRQMIKANRPIEKTLAFIEELEHGNLHNHATFVGLHVALQLGREKEALVLMDKLTEKANENPEMALRSHYFWPLMVSIGKGGRVEDLFDVLKRMSDQKISISLETVSDYVLPYCKNLSPDEMVSRLRASGVGMAMTLNGVTQHLLQRGDVAAAARTATSYGVSYLSWSYLGEDLRNAYLKTEDVESTLTVLACLGDAGGRQGRVARTVVDIPGTFCWHVFTGERKDPQKLEALLEGMASSGFGMSQSSSQKLIDGLGEKLTERISVALEKLSSVDDQQPNLPLLRRRPSAVRDRKAQIDSLESRLANAPTDDTEQRARLLRQILSLEIKEKNVSRVEEVLRRLENEQSVLPVGYLALLIDMYSQTGDVEKAFGLFEEFSKKHPTASMDTSKVLRLANALEAADRYEDAVTLLRNQKPSEATRTQDTSLNHLCWRLLHALAEKKEIGRIREVLDILRDNKIVEINNVLLGPLMKAHLATDDMDKAMETFEEAANIYHCTPWKNELTVKLINREDADRLQKVVDLSTKIHGEVNSLYDLVFCFLETGRTRQARRILETPGLRARNQRFEQICQRFVEEDRVEELENLISITKDIFDVDRGMLFMHLLKVYCKREDTSKALGVWTSLQEEDIQPNPAFLQYLGNYLQSRGQPVPFVIPADKPPVVAAAPKPAQQQQRPVQQQQRPVQQQQTQPLATNDSPAEGVKVSVLRRALRNGDIEGAMKLKEEIENRGEKVPVTDVSHLISSLLGSERLGEAVKMAEGMRAHSQHPLPATFKYLLARLAAAGDFDTVESLGKGLSTDLRKRISYDNHLCSALIHAGKGAEVLTNWEKILSDTGVDGLKSTFPVGGALAMLFNSPEVYPRFEKLAVAAAEGQYLAPMNMMWIWLLTSRDWEKSSCMLDKYLKNAEGLLFRSVLRKIRETNDCELAEELHKQVENCSVTPKSKGVVLSAVLDSHVATGAHDTALEKLDRSLNSKVCTLLDVNYTALERLKLALEATGKAFPYTMPPKKVEKESDAHQDEV